MKIHRVLIAFAAHLLITAPTNAEVDDVAITHERLDGLRGLQLPKEKEKIAELNKRMDAAWAFIGTHSAVALPLVEEELRKALIAKTPDQFFLLDIGFLLLTHQGAKSADLAVSALERLDPHAEIVQANWEEVFHFAMKLGATGRESERYLNQMDRLFLTNKGEINFFRPPHVVKLNQLDIGCMVYGVAGEVAAQHLVGLLGQDSLNRAHILQIMRGVGSEADVPAVKALMDTAKDFETLSVCIGFMMEVGGPSGRTAVLALRGEQMDPKAQKYYKSIRSDVNKVSFASITATLEKMNKSNITDTKLQLLLDSMEQHNGADSETPPAAAPKSHLKTELLLEQMKRIRARSFRRENNHVFEDLDTMNLVINALQFKAAKS